MPIVETPLSRVKVRDAMNTGILVTAPDTPLRVVASLMAQQQMHAVAVTDPDCARRPYGFVTASDIARAAIEEDEQTAGQLVNQDALLVFSDDRIDDAARKLTHRGVSHAIVIDRDTAHPVGVLSTLDIAAAYAG